MSFPNNILTYGILECTQSLFFAQASWQISGLKDVGSCDTNDTPELPFLFPKPIVRHVTSGLILEASH